MLRLAFIRLIWTFCRIKLPSSLLSLAASAFGLTCAYSFRHKWA